MEFPLKGNRLATLGVLRKVNDWSANQCHKMVSAVKFWSGFGFLSLLNQTTINGGN